jgi:hypothetical protein
MRSMNGVSYTPPELREEADVPSPTQCHAMRRQKRRRVGFAASIPPTRVLAQVEHF